MSGFLNDEIHNSTGTSSLIDFDEAIRLNGGGSTCDIYKTRWQRRVVFVKRLKEEVRSKPVYVEAMDKEFEVGVNLKHPSLPDYLAFHRDYIIMDFIDGLTLDEMIKKNDSWLKNEKNIVKLLKELVVVVDYLHRHNVTHCDIKPDNIMITANGHNLVLIDFDKCYTDALDDTSGHPGKFGLPQEEPGRMAMDFRGMAQVVESLKENVTGFKFGPYNKFKRWCFKPDVTAGELLELLDSQPTKPLARLAYSLTGLFVLAVITALFLLMYNPEASEQSPREDTRQETIEATENHLEAADGNPLLPDKSPAKPSPEERDINYTSQADLYLQDQKMAAILDRRIEPVYTELFYALEHLKEIRHNPVYTAQQMLDSMRRFCDLEEEIKEETWVILKETFPDITSDREGTRVLAFSKVYTEYNRQAAAEQKEYDLEYKRRLNQ